MFYYTYINKPNPQAHFEFRFYGVKTWDELEQGPEPTRKRLKKK